MMEISNRILSNNLFKRSISSLIMMLVWFLVTRRTFQGIPLLLIGNKIPLKVFLFIVWALMIFEWNIMTWKCNLSLIRKCFYNFLGFAMISYSIWNGFLIIVDKFCFFPFLIFIFLFVLVDIFAFVFGKIIKEEKSLPSITRHKSCNGVIYVAVICLALFNIFSFVVFPYSTFVRFAKVENSILIIVSSIICFLINKTLTKQEKLAPNISPNKTWSGFVSATIMTMVVIHIVLADGFDFPMTSGIIRLHHIIVYLQALSFVVTCQASDLLVSFFKRKFNAKNTSNLIPGHGGVLDRFDSWILSTPLFVVISNNSTSTRSFFNEYTSCSLPLLFIIAFMIIISDCDKVKCK